MVQAPGYIQSCKNKQKTKLGRAYYELLFSCVYVMCKSKFLASEINFVALNEIKIFTLKVSFI